MLRPSTLCLALHWMLRGSAALVLSAVLVSGRAAGLPFQDTGRASENETLRYSLEDIQQLIEKGDLAKAREQLSEVLKTSPKDPNALNLMGVIEAQEGNYPAAETDFQKALAAAPRLTGAYLNLGHLYQEQAAKDPLAMKKGLETYRRLLRYDPENVEAHYQTAYLLTRLGSFQPSLEHLARLPPAAQARAQALALKCADYSGLQDRAQADGVAEELAQSGDLSEADVTSIAPLLEKHQREDLEIKLLGALEERNLASPGSLFQLGVLLEKQGNYPQARDVLERAGQHEPDSVPLLIELARVAEKQNENKAALGYLAHARDLQPDNAAIHFFFGVVCIKENLAEEAYRSLKKAVSLDPENAYYNYAFGTVAVQRQDASEAIPYLKKYVELKPGDSKGKLALGAAYFYSHSDELAQKQFEPLVGIPELAPVADYFLGRVANQQGRFADAIRELHQALEANPKFADAYAELGLLHLKQKQYPEAEKALRQALDLDPESYTGNLNLVILYQRTRDPRADAQAKRFEEIRAQRAERAKEFLRTIVVQP